MESAQTRYARSQDGTSVAYQVVGDGPVDLMTTSGALGNVEFLWEIPAVASFPDQFAAISRLINYDRRGTGLSTARAGRWPWRRGSTTCWRSWMPSRASALRCWASWIAARPQRCSRPRTQSASRPLSGTFQPPAAPWQPTTRGVRRRSVSWGYQSDRGQLGFGAAVTAYFERGTPHWPPTPGWPAAGEGDASDGSPATALADMRAWYETDVRHVLPSIAVPTLVIDRDGTIPEEGEYTASHPWLQARRPPRRRCAAVPG